MNLGACCAIAAIVFAVVWTAQALIASIRWLRHRFAVRTCEHCGERLSRWSREMFCPACLAGSRANLSELCAWFASQEAGIESARREIRKEKQC
jgi:hypothetical protein